jgi:hypothetical protein
MSDQNPPGSAAYDHQKHVYEVNLRAAERAHDRNNEIEDLYNKNADTHAQAAIRILLTINGGAAVALLAFVAGLASKADRTLQQLDPIVAQLKWFILGVISSGIAAALAYVTSYLYAGAVHWNQHNWEAPYIVQTMRSKRWRYFGYALHLLGFSTAVAGLFLFGYGMYKVQRAIGMVR